MVGRATDGRWAGSCSSGASCRYGIPAQVMPKVRLSARLVSSHPPHLTHVTPPSRLEKLLVALRKQQREKIEDIKRKTNYYSTRTLLERYDDAPGADSPLRRRVVPQGVPATPQRAAPPASPQTPMQAPMSPNLQQHLSRACSPFLLVRYVDMRLLMRAR